MKSFIFSSKKLITILAFLFCLFSIAQAQTDPSKICEEGDCSPEIFSIKMDESSQPTDGTYSKQRTKKFEEAYLTFQQIHKKYSLSGEWRSKYAASQLGGKSCLRHYQLESYFANEYVQNTDFKDFVDNQGAGSRYLEKGFQGSRKGLNLEKRMKNNCPEEVKNVQKQQGPALAGMPDEYMNIGKKLGYFDEQGNLLKPLEIQKKPAPQKKMSKKEQVEDLKKKVNSLPVGDAVKNQVSEIANDLKSAKEKSGKLGGFLKNLLPAVAALAAPQLPILANLGKIKNVLGGLLSWKPKLPKLGLVDKIKGLFGKGEKLVNKAQGVVDQTKGLQDKFDKLTDKAKKLQNDVEDRIKKVTKLDDKLADLEKKKAELVAKLADKPKKNLDQLQAEVADAVDKGKDIADDITKELDEKAALVKALADLEKEKDDVVKEMDDLKKDTEDLAKAVQEIEKEKDETVAEVEAAKADDKKVEDMTQQLAAMPADDDLKEALVVCEDDLKSLLLQIEPVAETQKAIKEQYQKVADKPKILWEKVKNIKLFQKQKEQLEKGIPIAEKTLEKVNGLMEKANAISAIAEILTGKKTKLQEQIENVDTKVKEVQDTYDNRMENLEKWKGDLVTIISDKTNLKQIFDNAKGDVKSMETAYQDFIKKYNIFEQDSKCIDKNELEEKLAEIKEEQEEIEPAVEELEEEVAEAEKEEEALQEEIEEAEQELEEEVEQVEEIKQEEEKIKEEFGQDVELEPVKAEEWTESFEVEREYWDAVFHPDDEVVEGFKGRWFQVKLKDANKNVKLLFGPGEYFMDKGDFRDTYGSVIGAFVTEALNGMKKADREGIKLFVQGSADIAGQNTFKGNLDSKFLYNSVTVLPQKEDSDNFENTSTDKTIPEKGFTNTDLPNLRGNFLKEMISVYSKKLQPVLLEGAVKSEVDEGDRNAVIYLFIPEVLVDKYDD